MCIFDAETRHKLHLKRLALGIGVKRPDLKEDRLGQTILGQDFANPLGIAAGYDKYSVALRPLDKLGFAFEEIGSATPLAQKGNPRPRMHNLKADKAMINHMGLNNPGYDTTMARIVKAKPNLARMKIVVNLAKVTTQEDPAADYVNGVGYFEEIADWIVLNFSCPNVTGFKNLQDPEMAEPILQQVADRRAKENLKTPALVKIGPDLKDEGLQALIDLCIKYGIQGIVACNLTHKRPDSMLTKKQPEKGGLSGPPMRDFATDTISRVYKAAGGKLVIVGLGGISSAEDAYEKIRAGSNLLEIYTGLVYHGMGLAADIINGLNDLLERDGYANIADAVGADHK